MKVCIIGSGDSGSKAAMQVRHLDSEAQIAVPLHRLIDKLES